MKNIPQKTVCTVGLPNDENMMFETCRHENMMFETCRHENIF